MLKTMSGETEGVGIPLLDLAFKKLFKFGHTQCSFKGRRLVAIELLLL